MPGEEELIRRAKEHDVQAWAEIYEQNFDRVYRYILIRVGNVMEAEDLAEQVFLKALQSMHSYSWRGVPFSAWLFRIAHNLVVDSQRQLSRREKSLPDFIPGDENPARVVEESALKEEMIIALDRLTAAQRRVIELRFAAGLSTEETARAMGKSAGAIKALQHSALVSLRKILCI